MNRKLATTNQQKTRQYYEHATSNSTNQQKPRQYYEQDTSNYKPTKAETIIRTGH